MNIPSRVNPFGYDNSTPPGYFRVEFLESTGTQYVDTGVNINGTSGLFGIFEPVGTTPNGWAISAGVYKSYSFSPLIRYQDNVGFQYKDIARYPLKDGTWATSGTQVGNLGYKLKEKCQVTLNWLNDHQWSLECNTASIVYSALPTMSGLNNTLYLFARHYGNGVAERESVRIYKIQLSQGGQETNTFTPTIDSTGRSCMFDLVTLKPVYNEATTGSDFIVGMTTKQALNLANLPATGGSLTISLPLEAAFDDNVQSALNTAADKGWTITVRYRESELTTKNIDADFLESAGGSFIDTEIVPTNETGLSLTALPMSDLDTIPFGSRNSNSTASCFYAVRPRRLLANSSLVIANGYGWGTWSLIGPTNIPDGAALIKKEETYLNWFNNRAASSEFGRNWLMSLSFNPEFSMYLFAANISNSAQLYYIGRIWNAAVSVGTQLKANFIPALDSAGAPCMYDTVSGQNFYNANTTGSDFIVGFDTTEKAAISLSKLPVTTDGTLTVSLPAAAQDTDTLVPAAIDIATNRGWTIFPQYRTN